MYLISGIETFGKNAVVCGRSKNVGMPIAMLLHADGIYDTQAGIYGGSGLRLIDNSDLIPLNLSLVACCLMLVFGWAHGDSTGGFL